jgi:hypothetical protein
MEIIGIRLLRRGISTVAWINAVRTAEFGFVHTQIVYGDFTREIGYALKKLGCRMQWQCYSNVL